MATGISNNFIMSIRNETVYHTGDVLQLFDRMIECTPTNDTDGNRRYRILEKGDIDTLRIDYPTYPTDLTRAYWDAKNRTLTVRIPRLSSRKTEPSPLTMLAGMDEELDNIADTDYIYSTCPNMIHNTVHALSEAMNRDSYGSPINTDGLRLRYCGRLTAKRKAAQRLHILEHESKLLSEAGMRLKALAACYEQDIIDQRQRVAETLANS